MKRGLIVTVMLVMIFMSLPVNAAADEVVGTFENFSDVNIYDTSTFGDILSSDWYASYVELAYKCGIIDGKGNNIFDPSGDLTVAQAITMAAKVNKVYYGNEPVFEAMGTKWYEGNVQYAKDQNIIGNEFEGKYDDKVTRSQMVNIFASALPSEGFDKINEDFDIPDVDDQTTYNEAIQLFYDAGILNGSDAIGTFNPDSNINRAEAATIISRVIQPTSRTIRETAVETTVYDNEGPIESLSFYKEYDTNFDNSQYEIASTKEEIKELDEFHMNYLIVGLTQAMAEGDVVEASLSLLDSDGNVLDTQTLSSDQYDTTIGKYHIVFDAHISAGTTYYLRMDNKSESIGRTNFGFYGTFTEAGQTVAFTPTYFYRQEGVYGSDGILYEMDQFYMQGEEGSPLDLSAYFIQSTSELLVPVTVDGAAVEGLVFMDEQWDGSVTELAPTDANGLLHVPYTGEEKHFITLSPGQGNYQDYTETHVIQYSPYIQVRPIKILTE